MSAWRADITLEVNNFYRVFKRFVAIPFETSVRQQISANDASNWVYPKLPGIFRSHRYHSDTQMCTVPCDYACTTTK